jgi:Ca2+-binding EF-hand superfamily protein
MKRRKSEVELEKDLRSAFAAFDVENKGFITKEELLSGLSYLGEDITKEELDSFVGDSDSITYLKFRNLLASSE